jgi:hypothetical protein
MVETCHQQHTSIKYAFGMEVERNGGIHLLLAATYFVEGSTGKWDLVDTTYVQLCHCPTCSILIS